jgi:hypothetical protein
MIRTIASNSTTVLVAQHQLSALSVLQITVMRRDSPAPTVANVERAKTCHTPYCSYPSQHHTADCHWWILKRRLQEGIDEIQRNAEANLYKRRRFDTSRDYRRSCNHGGKSRGTRNNRGHG